MGLVQGLTEFLPVSSSAHLRIFGQILPGCADPGAAFTAIIQIGTELAVLLYFRRDVVRIVRGWWHAVAHREPNPDGAEGWLIIFGSIPIVVLGLLFQDDIETHLRNMYITGGMLVGFALIMGWFDQHARQVKPLEKLTLKDGLIYGCAQALALIPGVSRSGGTITAGLAMGYTREAAARYSFLLAMPAVFGSGLFELAKALGGQEASFPGWGPTIVAGIVAFVVGYFVIIAFLKIVSTYSFRPFIAYRVGAGLLVIVLLLCGVFTPMG